MSEVKQRITELAHQHRLTAVRFAPVTLTAYIGAYDAWLAAGYQGSMGYLVRGRDVRANPRLRLPGAATAVVVTLAYPHTRPPDPGGRTGMVARYAWGRDYHNLLTKRLNKVKRALRSQGIGVWGGVDTPPILERAWAQAAGAGVIGKNTVLFKPGNTSWLVLAVLFVDVAVPPDKPLVRDHCGSCTRCLSACPTSAFVEARVLDARRCIAYWTIEARGLPPRALRSGFGRWVFGCDLCQAVCPHNAASPAPNEPDLAPKHAWLNLDALMATPDKALMDRFVGTPLRRPGAHGLKRNALLVLANLGDSQGVPSARRGLAHPHQDVRAAAVWCLECLGATGNLPTHDPDPAVQQAIDAARRAPSLGCNPL